MKPFKLCRHRFEGDKLFEAVRVLQTKEGNTEPERYVAAEGYKCSKCPAKRVRYINVLGRYCKADQVSEYIRWLVDTWLKDEKIENLLSFGKK